jgi:cyclopropane fatty-acyl-phospholipid synthase-like methyltransferase
MEEYYFEDESYVYFSPFSHWLLSQTAKQRMDIIKRYLKGGHLLEIGPGTGELTIAAESEGFDIMAVESSKVFVDYVRSKTKATIYHGKFETADFEKTKFDGILSFHVLEHVRDTKGHLKSVFELLKPNGYLLLAMPNLSSWDYKLTKNRWTGYSPGHLNLFGLKSIKLCLKQAGLELVDIYSFESAFELLWSIKTWIKPKGNPCENAGSNIKKIPLQLGRLALLLFGALTKPLRFLQQRLKGGNELFIVARKPKP